MLQEPAGFERMQRLWRAPFTMQDEVMRAISNEAAHAADGHPARIIAKMNSLTDERVIEALYAAWAAGARIDLIVRGACTLGQASRDG